MQLSQTMTDEFPERVKVAIRCGLSHCESVGRRFGMIVVKVSLSPL